MKEKMAPPPASPSPPNNEPQSNCHVVLFPFMSKGHTIPLLRLARLLLRRGLAAAVTFITTPANCPYVASSLSGTAASVVALPFPPNPPFIPPGVENTDGLPSISDFFHLANATQLMRPAFERALGALSPPATFLVSDGFLGWTLRSTEALGIPRLVFFGMSAHAMAVCGEIGKVAAAAAASDEDDAVPVPSLPGTRCALSDVEEVFRNPSISPPHFDFLVEQGAASARSHGMIVNSFYEMEPAYVDFWNRNHSPRAWCVGPLCLAEEESGGGFSDPLSSKSNDGFCERPAYVRWLDEKLEEGKPVVYVAFGSQAEISREQAEEIAAGLEESGAHFLWAARGLEERARGRGVVVRGWVAQREVLGHAAVVGFVSHCGWNSVMESVSAGVAVAAFPAMAEQFLNARMVVEVVGMGVRVGTRDGRVRGLVGREGVAAAVRELVEGEKGKEVRKRAAELAAAARLAAATEGGSSWRTLEALVRDACEERRRLRMEKEGMGTAVTVE